MKMTLIDHWVESARLESESHDSQKLVNLCCTVYISFYLHELSLIAEVCCRFGLVAYYANTSQLSPRIGWYAIAIDCKVFEIQSHATIDAESLSNRLLPILYNRNFDTSCRDVIVRGANSKAMSKQTAKTALVIGYMRSYENMATAKMFLDGHLLGEVDGLWSHHSSQYNSVGFDTLVVGPGQHVLEIEVQPDLSPDKQRGLNKFKLLEILVY